MKMMINCRIDLEQIVYVLWFKLFSLEENPLNRLLYSY